MTGRTEKRGYMQELEREKNDMVRHIQDLETLLSESGVEVRPSSWTSRRESSDNQSDDNDAERQGWTRRTKSLWVKSGKSNHAVRTVFSPGLKSSPLNNHIGLISTSSSAGSKLSILGMTIDIDGLDDKEAEDLTHEGQDPQPLYTKSLQSFLQSAMNVNPLLSTVELPAREDAFTYAEWYFLMIFPFLPVLHKPTFMALVCLASLWKTRLASEFLTNKAFFPTEYS